MNDNRPVSRARAPMSLRIRLIVGAGIIAVAGIVWAVLTYWGGGADKQEVVVYRLCVGSDKGKCPAQSSFVRNEGEETVSRWAQRQCASYQRRRIIVNEGPADCNCTIADVTCSSE